LSENVLIVGKLWSKNAKFGAQNSILEKFKGKIEILSSHNLAVENLQLSVGKLQLPNCATLTLAFDLLR